MFDVVTIGTATRDVFVKSKGFKTVHDPKHLEKLGFVTGDAQCFGLGQKVEIEKPVLTVGGGAANAAVTFARQGFSTAALFKIGHDQSGRDVLGDMRAERVTSLCVFDEHEMTGYSVILVSSDGERTILHYRGASEDFKKTDVPSRALKARWAYIVPGGMTLEVVQNVVERLHKNNVRVAMNPSRHLIELGLKKVEPVFRKLDVVLMNREEGAYLTGEKFEDEKKIFRKFDDVVPGLAVLTDGKNGVMVSDGKTVYHAGVFKERCIADRTGSGDAFGSGFVASLASEKPDGSGQYARATVERAIRLGSANATSVVEHIGAQAGILSKRKFVADRRWKELRITEKKTS
jgi:sugar/nucleoside kinase (ribokinase family)